MKVYFTLHVCYHPSTLSSKSWGKRLTLLVFYFLAHVGFGATFGIAKRSFGSCQHVSGM